MAETSWTGTKAILKVINSFSNLFCFKNTIALLFTFLCCSNQNNFCIFYHRKGFYNNGHSLLSSSSSSSSAHSHKRLIWPIFFAIEKEMKRRKQSWRKFCLKSVADRLLYLILSLGERHSDDGKEVLGKSFNQIF